MKAVLGLLLLTAIACASDAPYVLVLGTAQDGGLPQIGCRQEICEDARADPSLRRFAASILLADPRSGKRWLFDASPDIRDQVELARGHPPTRVVEGPRPPLFDGIFLTHAHVGHYLGLAHLGREVYGAKAIPVHASPKMCAYLAEHGPWELLVRLEQIALRPLAPDATVELGDSLKVEPALVPHRPEYSDTYAYFIQGPKRRLLYVPDIDKWERWDRAIEDVLASVDVALVDATFYADAEVPGRDISEIPHPFVSETLERLADLPAKERAKVVFTHLNHTNPATVPGGEAQSRIRKAGMRVAREGDRFEL